MGAVYTGNYYMRVWETNTERYKGRASFEPDFSPNDLIKLGSSFYIGSKEKLKKIVEKQIFSHYSQFKPEEFDCREGDYGWEYEGLFIMDKGRKIKQDKESYTHSIVYEVEVYYMDEVNAMERLKQKKKGESYEKYLVRTQYNGVFV